MAYYTEGYIKSITVESKEVKFTLAPVTPYMFEAKEDNKVLKKIVLLKKDGKGNLSDKGVFIDEKTVFSMKEPLPPLGIDVNSLLILKTNRVKIGVKIEASKASTKDPHTVTSIEVL